LIVSLSGYAHAVGTDPLLNALEEIAPRLDPELGPMVTAIMAGEPVETAWQDLLQDVLDEA
jgi:hypothetical protein